MTPEQRQEEAKKVRTALNLYRSMVACGERGTAESQAAFIAAHEGVDALLDALDAQDAAIADALGALRRYDELDLDPLEVVAAVRALSERGETMSDTENAGTYWLAYHSDWSGFVVFADELSALRHALTNCMDGVIEVPFGADIIEWYGPDTVGPGPHTLTVRDPETGETDSWPWTVIPEKAVSSLAKRMGLA